MHLLDLALPVDRPGIRAGPFADLDQQAGIGSRRDDNPLPTLGQLLAQFMNVASVILDTLNLARHLIRPGIRCRFHLITP